MLQGLIEEPSAVRSYHSLDPVPDEADAAAELPDMEADVQPPTEDMPPSSSSSSVVSILLQFVTRHSYIGTLIVMMVRRHQVATVAVMTAVLFVIVGLCLTQHG